MYLFDIKKAVLFFAFSSFAIICHAQTIKQEDIDIDYNKCVSKDTACPNVSDCAFKTYAAWEKQMSESYDRIMKELKEEHKVILRESQTAWLAYKDATFHVYDEIYNRPGDFWCRMRHEGRIDVLRKRTQQLRKYFEDLRHK